MLNAETVVPKPQEAGTREYNAPPLSTMIPLTWVNNVNILLFCGQKLPIFALLINLWKEKKVLSFQCSSQFVLPNLFIQNFAKEETLCSKKKFFQKYSPMNPEPRNSAKLLGNFSNPKYSNLL